MRTFQARETDRLLELDGIELADFWQRALAFLIDLVLALVALFAVTLLIGLSIWIWRTHHGHPEPYNMRLNLSSELDKLLVETLTPVLYFGISTWLGHGRSPGKWLLRIRVVSLVHAHLSFWHSVERALGYGAAALEFGFGFAQFFIHPFRRTVEDRIAETIVVQERSFRRHLASSSRAQRTPVPVPTPSQPVQ